MKKAIYMFVLGILFLASSGLASAAWNTYPSDCPLSLSIGNYTTGDGIQNGSNGCWTKTNVGASAGQTVNVAVYFDNTNGTDANNATISLTQSPAGSMSSKNSSYSFSGSLTSSAGSLSLSPVSVNLSSSETLTFSQAQLFKKGAQTGTSVSGYNAFGGGLSIGNITSGDWGTVVFSFSVGTTTAPQVCADSTANNIGSPLPCTFTQTPQYSSYTVKLTVIGSGKITTVNSPNINSVATYKYPINSDFFGFVPDSGYHIESATLDGSTISTGGYALYDISANHEIRVTFVANQVVTPACSISNFDASPSSITSGGYSSLSWNTTNCTNVTISNLSYNVPTSSNGQAVYPTTTTTYILTANGTITRNVTVTVTAAPVICTDPNANNRGSVGICTFTQTPQYSSYTITATAGYGGSISPSGVTSYTYPNNSKFYVITPNSGYTTKEILVDGVSQPLVGGYAFYYISANHTISASFTQTQQIAKSCSATLYASNISITKGEATTLIWTLADCTNATLYPTVGPIYSSNSQIVYPTSSTLYTLTATDANGTITRTATVTVNQPAQPANNSTSSTTNNSTTNSNNNNSVNNSNNNNSVNNSNNTTINNAPLAPVQTILPTCLDTSASNYGSYGICVYNNYNTTRCLDTSASNYWAYGTCVYNNYNTTRCTDSSASNYLAYSSCIYNQTRCLDTSASNYLAYNYCVYNNNQGQCLDSSASNYLTYNACVYYVNKNVVTTVATNITSNQAQINGYITNSAYYNSNVYFNYGTTVNLGSRTNSKVASGNSYFNDFITGLTPNTIYFFQAVGENNTGTSKGNIEVFKTLTDGTVSPVIIQGTTVIGTNSPVQLTITNKYELIGVGDLIDYTVTYKNVSKGKLSRPMVQVVLPTNVTLVNASRGTYSVDNHTLSAPLADLLSGEEGVIYLQGKVDSIPLNSAQIATTAILVYTNNNNAQENAMAYVLNQPKVINGTTTDGSVLGASAFFAGFMSIGVIGWLLIILLILIIILIAKSYSRNDTKTDSKTIIHTTTH